MGHYIAKRIALMIPTLFVISILSFIVIQLPPGDIVSVLLSRFEQTGFNQREMDALRTQYGLDRPMIVQYWRWISGIVARGDFGFSYTWNLPVSAVLEGRIGRTILISGVALLFTWVIALPIGIYSAVRQYSLGDYVATLFGFVGLAVPNFLIALIFMYVAFRYFGQSVGGLFSPEYMNAPWSWARFVDLLRHLWIPMIVIGTAGTANLIRVTRANLLDELGKPYVTTARAKGLTETRLVLRYPVRVALNPFISTVGWILPALVSGSTIVAVVLNLPTTGPILLDALLAQDMYVAGSIVLILSFLTVIGTLLSDLLLAWVDPRIRYR